VAKQEPICGHTGCLRPGVVVVSHEEPQHREFFGQTHDCCNVHKPRAKRSHNPNINVREPHDIGCSQEGCERWIKNNAWAKIKAEEWLFQKDGTAWCPDHLPGWVAEWRARKKARADSTA